MRCTSWYYLYNFKNVETYMKKSYLREIEASKLEIHSKVRLKGGVPKIVFLVIEEAMLIR